MNESKDQNSDIVELYNIVLDTLISISNPYVSLFLDDLPSINNLQEQNIKPTSLPIMNRLKNLGQVSRSTTKIVSAIVNTAENQAWRQPYDVDDFGEKFYDKSGWFPIADVDGPLIYNKGLVEVMLLDANTKYPNHRHTPEELYIVLAGKVWWEAELQSKSSWKVSGEVMHHPSNCTHSITSGNNPALLLAIWRGGSFEKPVIK